MLHHRPAEGYLLVRRDANVTSGMAMFVSTSGDGRSRAAVPKQDDLEQGSLLCRKPAGVPWGALPRREPQHLGGPAWV